MSRKIRSEIRADMRRVLASLDARWIEAASKEVSERLSAFLNGEAGSAVTCLLAWIPAFPGEVDLTGLIGEQLGKREVYLPRVLPDGTMTFLAVGKDWSEGLEESALGIPEPSNVSGKPYQFDDAPSTVILTPGLAFDPFGNRLGRGRGFYDKFFGQQALDSAIRVGVCWSLQRVPHIPTFEHDIPVHWICDEREMSRARAAAAQAEGRP